VSRRRGRIDVRPWKKNISYGVSEDGLLNTVETKVGRRDGKPWSEGKCRGNEKTFWEAANSGRAGKGGETAPEKKVNILFNTN